MKQSFIKKITGLLIVLIMLNKANAQQTIITGKVKDSANNQLGYTTVGLYSEANNKNALQIVVTDKEGMYKFLDVDTGRYTVLFSFSGYVEQKIPVNILPDEKLKKVPDIILVKMLKELQEVTVKAKKMLVEIKDDGISYNAEADPMANTDKLIDLLRKTPMVTVDGNDNVEINGQSNFKVLLNGRETSMFSRNVKQALKSFPGSMVKRIDIITNPSAKYDAEGIAGIINIITKKKVVGYNGTMSAEANTQTYRGADASFNFKYGKIGLTAFASIGGNNGLSFDEEETIEALTPASFYKRNSTGNTKQFNNSPQANIELNYEADSLNTFSFYGSFDKSNGTDNTSKAFNLIPASQIGSVQSHFNSESYTETPGWSGGMDYIRKFKTNADQEFSIKLFGSFGNEHINNSSEQLSGSGNRYILNRSEAADKQYTIQADYIHPFKKKQKLEIGIKTILRRASSDYESLQKFNMADQYKLNQQNSDNFTYQQDVYSAYASYSFSIKKINFRTGLRLEHTEVDGEFITSQTKVAQTYTNIIPNLLIATRFKNGHNISFSYSLRLSRPYISNLNPFVNNIDSLTVYIGNPALEPQLFHNTSLQYRFKKGKLFTNISLGNSYSNSNIVYGYTFNNTTGVSTFSTQNNGISNRIYLNVGVNGSLNDKWNLNINGGTSYYSIKSQTGFVQQNAGFAGNIGYNTSYKITPKFAATNFFNYYFPVVLLQGKANGYFAYGFAGKYQIFNDKITLSAYINNGFNKDGIFKRISSFEDSNSMRVRTQYILFRGVGLNIAWNFGKLSGEVSKKRGVSNTDLL